MNEKTNTTMRELLEKALREGGYDGLTYPLYECSCWLSDNSLFLCDSPNENCQAGHRWYCLKCTEINGCDWARQDVDGCCRLTKQEANP